MSAAQRSASQNFSARAEPGCRQKELAVHFRVGQDVARAFHRRRRQIQLNGLRRVANSERGEQGEMVIHRVHEADRRLHQLVVTERANLHPLLGMIRGDAPARAGEQGQKGGAIVAGEVQAVIVFLPRDREPSWPRRRFSRAR